MSPICGLGYEGYENITEFPKDTNQGNQWVPFIFVFDNNWINQALTDQPTY